MNVFCDINSHERFFTHLLNRVHYLDPRLNLLPALFPNAAAKAERKIVEKMQETHSDRIDPNTPKVRVFFPWKAMLLISLGLTLAVNLVGIFAR